MLPLLIAGIILRLTDGWFASQHLVGDILIWAGAITTLVPLLFFGLVSWGILHVRR